MQNVIFNYVDFRYSLKLTTPKVDSVVFDDVPLPMNFKVIKKIFQGPGCIVLNSFAHPNYLHHSPDNVHQYSIDIMDAKSRLYRSTLLKSF